MYNPYSLDLSGVSTTVYNSSRVHSRNLQRRPTVDSSTRLIRLLYQRRTVGSDNRVAWATSLIVTLRSAINCLRWDSIRYSGILMLQLLKLLTMTILYLFAISFNIQT